MKQSLTFILFLFIQISYGQSVSLVSTYATGITSPSGLDFDSNGNLFVAQGGTSIIKITPSGTQTTFASGFGNIQELKIDAANNIFAADQTNSKVTKIDAQGNQTVIASQSGYHYVGLDLDATGNAYTYSGSTAQKPHILSFTGTSYSELTYGGIMPYAGNGIALDANGLLYVASDQGLAKTNSTGTVTVIAAGLLGADCEVDPSGNIFLTTFGNNVIKKVDLQGTITVFAGTGTKGTVDGSLTTAEFSQPNYLCLHNGDMYISDRSSGNIRKISNVYPITSVDNKLYQDLPQQFSLSQNYPNPFNPSTSIEFQIPQSGFVTLNIFDVLGKEAATLVNEEKNAGSYSVNFDASHLSSGIYFYELRAGNFIQIKKMSLIK